MCHTKPKHPRVVAEELEWQLGPARALFEIIATSAYNHTAEVKKGQAEVADDNHEWYDKAVPWQSADWSDPDYSGIALVDAMIMGLAWRYDRAFFELSLAVDAYFEWERKAGAK